MMINPRHAFALLILAGICTFLFLPACQASVDGELVGRWEMEDDSLGWAYEFYPDGSGVFFISPYQVNDFTYLLDANNVLETTHPLNQRKQTYRVTFKSEDVIEIQQERMEGELAKPVRFVRKALPELPAHARVMLKVVLKDDPYVITSAEKIEDQNSLDLTADQIIYRTEVTFEVGKDTEEWLVNVTMDGEAQARKFILVKGSQVWGVIELVK